GGGHFAVVDRLSVAQETDQCVRNEMGIAEIQRFAEFGTQCLVTQIAEQVKQQSCFGLGPSIIVLPAPLDSRRLLSRLENRVKVSPVSQEPLAMLEQFSTADGILLAVSKCQAGGPRSVVRRLRRGECRRQDYFSVMRLPL